MVKDGEDWHGLKNKSLAKLFKPFNRDWAPLMSRELVKFIKLSANYRFKTDEQKTYKC